MITCACGRPLHYPDQRTQQEVQKLVDELGEFIVVKYNDGDYCVSRHYIALHGLTPGDIATLASQGIITRQEDDCGS